ncbi:ATP-dependent nuclease [Paenibacillus hubeiensis]|uniref:ATP-dependent nuclease n=1 Tax=Paenibacillus hubeiensis TaxID=3077330 RepID=UPI0031BB43D6
MRLSKLIISNFRCYGPKETVIDFEDITTFIGANSSGKSSALQALSKMFGETAADRTLEKSDFYVAHNEVLEDLQRRELYIEVIFTFPIIKNEDGDSEHTEYAVPTYFDNFVVEKPGEPPYLRIRLQASWEQSNTPDGIIESKICYMSMSEDAEEVATKVPPSELSQIKIIYVPAIRNPSTLLRNATGTLLWRVLKSINWSSETKENIKIQLKHAEESLFEEAGLERVRDSLKGHWKKYHKDARYSEANIRFNSTDLDQLIKKFEVDFMPSITQKAYSIDSLGDGLRSLFYLSLVDSFLEIEQQAMSNIEGKSEQPLFNIQIPALTILAIEEPENHVSPHLLGNIIVNLNRIALKKNSQVILTSHTPAIVKRVSPESIRYFTISIEELVTKVKRIVLPQKNGSIENEEAYKYVKEAVRAYPEIYFSKLVILGEGDSEEIILPKAIELETDDHLDTISVSVVPLGGRHVNHFWRLLNELDIPYVTLLDLDKEREGGGWGRIKYVLEQLMDLGYKKEDLLKLKDGSILSDENLEKMHKMDEGADIQRSWINYLQRYNVFFSYPLDLDFMMLEAFPEAYKSTIKEQEGPRIDKIGKIIEIENHDPLIHEYKERVELATRHTLKKAGGTGKTYTYEQKKLMIWYDYFFLQRGKPVTHRLALLNISDETFSDRFPDPLKRLLARVKQILNGE